MATSDPVRVMVVDDQADVRFLVGIILGDHPDLHLVAEADGAEQALAVVGDTTPDVALVDARMPLIDGYELVPRLLAARPGLRIAMLTSIVDEIVEAQALAAGAVACVSKADFDALPDVVRRLAAG